MSDTVKKRRIRRGWVKRKSPVPRIVTLDTNILWHQDKSFIVSPDFEAFWTKNSKLIPLELVISDVVLGELKFQQATSAVKKLKIITDSFLQISKITGNQHNHKISDDILRDQVCAKIDRWLEELGGSVEPIPHSEIDWQMLASAAIWRQSPFTFDTDNSKNEKGFRDALILETVMKIVSRNRTTNKKVVFVCHDTLLREAFKARVVNENHVQVFETLNDLEADIHLNQQDLTEKFVKEIQYRAAQKFWDRDTASGIYVKDEIYKSILSKFAKEINEPLSVTKPAKLGSLLAGFLPKLTQNRPFIGTTQFRNLVQPNEYHWASQVIFAQLFLTQTLPTPTPTADLAFGLGGSGYGFTGQPENYMKDVRLVNFDILWKAKVKSDGSFHDVSLKEIKYSGSISDETSDEILKRWGF